MGSYRTSVRVQPGHDFRIRVGRGRRADAYQVRCLPEGFPGWKFERLRSFPDGLFVLGSRAKPGHPPYVAIFDHDGVPRWWYRSKTRAINAQVLRAGTVVWSRAYGDGYGRDPRQAQEVHTLSGRLVRLIRTKGVDQRPARAVRGAERQRPAAELRPRGAGRPPAARRAPAWGDRLPAAAGADREGEGRSTLSTCATG